MVITYSIQKLSVYYRHIHIYICVVIADVAVVYMSFACTYYFLKAYLLQNLEVGNGC